MNQIINAGHGMLNQINFEQLNKLLPQKLAMADELVNLFVQLGSKPVAPGKTGEILKSFFEQNKIPIKDEDLCHLMDGVVLGSGDCKLADVTGVVKPSDPKGVLTRGELEPIFNSKIESLLKQADAEGLSVFLFEGYRDFKKQDAFFEKGVTRARAGQSFHNYGLAADIVFYDSQDKPSWSEKHDWQRLGDIGKSLGLTWGGDFKSIVDQCHFEFHPGLGIKDVQTLYQKDGLKGVWDGVF